MADTKLTIFQADATTAAIDYRTESTNGDGRQVITIGDPASNNAVAAVMASDPTSALEGLVVRDVNTSAIVSRLGSTLFVSLDPGHLLGSVTANAGTGSFTVQLDPGHTLGIIDSINKTINVQLDPGHTLGAISNTGFNVNNSPTVTANAGTGSFNVQFDPGHTLGNIGTIGSITNTIAVFFSPASPAVSATFSAASIEVIPTTGSRKTTDDASASQRVLIVGSQTNASLTVNGTVTANAGSGTMTVAFDPGHQLGNIGSLTSVTNTVNVILDPGHTLGTVLVNPGTGTLNVQLDPAHTLGKVEPGVGTFTVKTDPSSVIQISNAPSITGITNSINVYLGATAGTLGVRVGQVDGTVAVYFSQSKPAVLSDIQGTASLFTASGSASGVSVSGNTIISPSANASFKVYAYSIQTTGQVSLATKFTNGAGTSPTEFWRPLVTASGVTGAQGANLATQPGAPLFVTGTSTTLSLLLDSATLVHYSVSYTKESA